MNLIITTPVLLRDITELSTEWWWDDGSDQDHAPLQGLNHVLLNFDF